MSKFSKFLLYGNVFCLVLNITQIVAGDATSITVLCVPFNLLSIFLLRKYV